MKLQFDGFDSSTNAQEFFGGANRQELLNTLLEQSSYSSNVLAIMGRLGTGKSVLAGRFIQKLDSSFELVSLEATLFMEPEALLDAICGELRLVRDQVVSGDNLMELIDSYVESLSQRGRTLQLVIDDAHELSAQSLGVLVRLVERQRDKSGLGEDGIKLALFGEAQLLSTLEGLITDKLICFELTELDADEFLDYVEFRLAAMGRSGKLVVTDDLLESIYQESAGIPAAIDAILAREAEAQPASVSMMPKFSFPERHLVAASALFGALLLVLYIMAGNEEPDVSDTVAIDAQPSGQVQLPVAVQIPSQELPRFEPIVADTLVPQTAVEETPLLPNDAAPVVEPDTQPSIPQEVAVADSGTLEISPGEEIEESLASAEENPVVGATGRIEFPEPSVDAVVEAEPIVAATPQQATELKEESDVGASIEVAVQEAPQSMVSVVDESDLLARSPEQYALQLLGSRSEPNVQSFIDQHQDRDMLTYFETRHEGRPWFVVVYGNYPDGAAAKSAIASLPSSLREHSPWPRSVGDIQASIVRYQP